MLTGPTVINCFSSSEGFGQCVQTRLADAGLLPRPAAPPVVADSEEAVGAVSEAAAEPEVAIAEPALDVTPPAEPVAVPDNLIAATFGLLRAEPDGSVVIAGSGTPGSEIEVYANGSLLGRATVETSGDWVLVPDAPLPIGPLEITLGEKGKTGQAEQSFVVVINEDKKSQPLVVASTPGQASDILQGLERPQIAEVAQVPAAVPVQPDATAPAEMPSAEAVVTPATPAPAATDAPAASTAETDAALPAAETVAASDPAPVATETASPAGEPSGDTPTAGEAAAPVETAEAQPSAPAEVPAATETSAPPAAEAPEGAALAEATEPTDATTETAPEAHATDEPQTQIAAVEQPTQPTTSSSALMVPPTIDAIEIEGDRTFFAGAGPDGATVRLYVDNAFVADAQVDGGRWLVEAGSVLNKPNQRIRIDLLQSGSAAVAGRAEVDFVVELPEGEEPTAVAAADPAVPAVTPTETAATQAEAIVAAPTPASTEPAAPAAPDASTSAPATPVPPAADAPATQPTLAETPAVQPSEAPAQPAETPAVAQAPAAEAEATAVVPTMVAVSMGGADAQRFAAGKAIIRRGDNLWTIARRVYGTGIKFTTIYEANSGQIRDPDRIYPGQVFSLPTD